LWRSLRLSFSRTHSHRTSLLRTTLENVGPTKSLADRQDLYSDEKLVRIPELPLSSEMGEEP
jgi:hypothetical protein